MSDKEWNHFQFEGEFVEAKPYGNGHINDTALLCFRDEDGVKRYICIDPMWNLRRKDFGIRLPFRITPGHSMVLQSAG